MPISFVHVPDGELYHSEPNPSWFGNPANERTSHWTNDNWLKSRFHFSFAEYSNPRNTNFGALRVMNDDLVQGQRGFGMHGHRDVEIVTYIVEGRLTHQDSMGTRETLGPGSVQFMSAGTGIQHSEHNLEDIPLRFVQIWIKTRRQGLPPVYGGFDGTSATAREARKNELAQLVGDKRGKEAASTPVTIEQDFRMYVSELEGGKSVAFPLSQGRQAYLLCVAGELLLKDAGPKGAECRLARHDAAEIRGEGQLTLAAPEGVAAHVLLLEMESGSGGRGPGRWPMHVG